MGFLDMAKNDYDWLDRKFSLFTIADVGGLQKEQSYTNFCILDLNAILLCYPGTTARFSLLYTLASRY